MARRETLVAWLDFPGAAGIVALCCALVLASSGVTAHAQREPRTSEVAEFGKAFEAWAARAKVSSGTLTVRHGGRLVHQSSIGGADPAKPVLLASLSKAITGLCIASLIDDGAIDFSTTLGTALAGTFAANGRPSDPRVNQITIEQLLTHRAGFGTRPVDTLTAETLRPYLAEHTAREASISRLLAQMLRRPLAFPPGQRFAYSNAGYLALGAVIEEASKRDYESACKQRVLEPMGVKQARLLPEWRIASSFAGWSMTGPDYLDALEAFNPERSFLKRRSRAWMQSPEGKHVDDKRKVWYGLGVRARPQAANGHDVFHFGGWRWQQTTPQDGRIATSIGAFATRLAEGPSIFAAWEPSISDEARSDLAATLTATARSHFVTPSARP